MMSPRQFAKHLVVLVGLAALPMMSYAGDLGPVIPKAKMNVSDKTQCVEPLDVMRRNHMDLLDHKRDETLRQGVRTKKHSLVECIDCHVTPNDKGDYARIGEDGHFCSSCHTYAGVSIDCFSCHSDLPVDAAQHMHSLNKKNPHHKDMAKNESLTKETLNLLTEGGKQ